MEEQRVPLQFRRNEDQPPAPPVRGTRWQQTTEERGPYETSYNITLGYPDREIVSQ
jgi:hypothetical protein